MYNHKTEKRVEEYVTGLFEQLHAPALAFHNIDHTKTVVKRANEIAANYNLSEKELFVLTTAAWFHDTGYLFTEPAEHEKMSCEVMRKYMKDHTDEPTIVEIEGCIMATKFPTNPKTLPEQILCDADTYNFGTKDFKETNKKAYKEAQSRNPELNKTDFIETTIKLLESHSYYTSYCQQLLDVRKQKNMQKLEQKLRNKESEKDVEDGEPKEPTDLSDIHKDNSGFMSKGIHTMLRLTSANHLRLSEMADHKANILISVNAIIISVILSVLLRKLQEETYLIIPTIIFLLVAVVTIVLSILATRPKISEGNFTMDEVKEKKTNLLFFGNFYKASYRQYDEAMRDMMLDTDYLYGSLIKDIYYLGVVLGRKYKLLRLAYNIFMIGIVVSVIAFAIAAFFSNGSSGTVINGTGSPF
jgi:predicted metal-dependent HD superfamily phosphohydrolase